MPDVVLSKKFDARNGNNAAIGTDTYPAATLIAYQDAAVKTEVINAVCALANYDALDPATRPSRAAFARNEIKNFLRAKVQENRQRVGRAKYIEPDASDLP